MRFEFDQFSVMALIRAIYSYLESLHDEGISIPYIKQVFTDVKSLYLKVQDYSLEAFGSREKYRDELKGMKEIIEEFEEEWRSGKIG